MRPERRTDRLSTAPPPVGQGPLVVAALAIGLLLMAGQLWLLTVALDRFLAGQGSGVWGIAMVSGVIFLGGLSMLWLLQRRPRIHGMSTH